MFVVRASRVDLPKDVTSYSDDLGLRVDREPSSSRPLPKTWVTLGVLPHTLSLYPVHLVLTHRP